MNGSQRNLSFSSILVMLLALSFPTWAASPDELAVAKKLFQEAEVHQKNERWVEALERLERVVAIKETAGVRFHMATCHENLGHFVKALEAYERAQKLAQATDTEEVLDMVGPEIERLRARVAEVTIEAPSGVGPLEVHVGQSVYSNISPGELLRLDPGTHHVVVKVDGAIRLDRLVSLDSGQSEKLQVKDWRETQPVVMVEERESAPDSLHATSARVPTMAWVSFGMSVALGAGGYVAYNKADSIAKDSARVCAQSISCDPARVDAVRRWDGLALGMWVGAAVGMGTGLALTLVHAHDKSETAVVLSPSNVQVRTSF